MPRESDIAVLGAGPGGYVAALRAAARGAPVCLIEAGQIGGCCLNVGCIPAKAMLSGSERLRGIQTAGRMGLRVEGTAAVDGPAFMARVAKTVEGLRKGVEGLLAARKVQVVRGRGRLVGRDTIEVQTAGGSELVRAGAIIIATGSRPVRPAFLPWDSGLVWTTDEATVATDLPPSILIIGGGVIGCEFATAYCELGAATTVVEMMDRVVPALDADVSRAIARSLKERGANVFVGARVAAVRAGGAGGTGVIGELDNGQTIEAARLLVCIGRKPNVEELGLEGLGLEMAGGVIAVDEHCRTNIEGVYAIGDVAETRQYAHLASRMGVVAADNAVQALRGDAARGAGPGAHAANHAARDDRSVVPIGIYTHPQVATVGLSEEQARALCGGRGGCGDAVRVARFPLQASGMAQIYDETLGQIKIVAHSGTGQILGACIIAPHAADLIQELALAMKYGLTVEQVAETIHAHPTFVEAIGEAADSWLGLPVHVLR